MLTVLYESTGDSKVTLCVTPQTGAVRNENQATCDQLIINQMKWIFNIFLMSHRVGRKYQG